MPAENQYVAVVDEPGPGAPEVVTFVADSSREVAVEVDELEDQGEVLAVQPDEPVTTLAVDPSNDPLVPQQWGLGNSEFAPAWASGLDGTGETIAVVDTGVAAAHEDLNGKVLQGADMVTGTESDGYQGTTGWAKVDPHGHGTHVAGIAAAADNELGGIGGAPGAHILPVRVLNSCGSGSTSGVVAGIGWAVDHGADVINLSLGGDIGCAAFEAVLEHAESSGVVVVAAAGNSNSTAPIYPAGCDGSVIAVGATMEDSTTHITTKAGFSNYGPYVDIGAPGDGIVSTIKPGPSTYASLRGTSMATPFVAAAVAIVLQKCPTISGDPTTSVGDKILSLLQASGATIAPPHLGGAPRLQVGTATAAGCPT